MPGTEKKGVVSSWVIMLYGLIISHRIEKILECKILLIRVIISIFLDN